MAIAHVLFPHPPKKQKKVKLYYAFLRVAFNTSYINDAQIKLYCFHQLQLH